MISLIDEEKIIFYLFLFIKNKYQSQQQYHEITQNDAKIGAILLACTLRLLLVSTLKALSILRALLLTNSVYVYSILFWLRIIPS